MIHPRIGTKRRVSPLIPALLTVFCAPGRVGAQVAATVSVDASKPLGTMAAEALGIGVAVWDGHMMDPVVPGLVKDAGFKVVRYPGGSYADLYHWKTHAATKGMQATIQRGVDFDNFMTLVRRAGATPLITVNYGSNESGTGGADPQEAAEWVRYANKTKRYGVKYWEIGNEVYGNGFYNGKGWEADLHAPDTGKSEDRLKNPLLGPHAYGRNVNAFVAAMKAEDPSIKVGVVLCGPGHWPDGVDPDWNTNVLKICGDKIDFVVIHWYGEGRSAAEALNSLKTVPNLLARLRRQVDEHCGANAKNVQIWMTEGDAGDYNTRHPGALFAADHFLTWWKGGATHVNWWNLHNGAVRARDGGLNDQGILSNGSRVGDLVEPPANTPFPPYYGVRMVNYLTTPGDTFLASESGLPTLSFHAVRKRNGRLGLMLINKDPDRPIQVTVTLKGLKVAANGTRYDYEPGSASIRESKASGFGPTFTVTVPAYGLSVLLIPNVR